MDIEDERQHILKRNSTADEKQEIHVYKRRWWVTVVLALAGMLQASVWSTWGPVAESSELVFGWTDGTIGQISLMSGVFYVIAVLPFSSFMDTRGLRASMLVCSSLLLVCTLIRCFTLEPIIFTPLAHIAAALQGMSGVLAFSGPALFAALWFPLEQRALATALVSFFNYFGETVTFVIAPLLVPSPVYVSFNGNNESHQFNGSNNSDIALTEEQTTTRYENQTDFIVTNIDAMKAGVQHYMYLHASMAGLLFIFSIIYFPSRPPKPPSITASMPRTNYKEAFKKVIRNGQLWIIVMAGAFPRALFGSWLAVFDVVVKHLGVSQLNAGWIAFWHMLIGCIAGVIFAKFSDFLGSRRKGLIIVMSIAGLICGVWAALLCDGSIPFDMTALYASCILLGVFVNGLLPLFYEMSAEAAYPVGEGTAGGIYTLVFVGFEVVYFGILSIPNIGVTWMTWFCVAALCLSVPLLVVFKEKNHRDLRFNEIRDIPRGAFRAIPLLDTLLLNNNVVEVLRDGAFEGLHDLRYLYLYKNKLREIEPKVFKHLHKLEQLFLHGNQLQHLPEGLLTYNKQIKRLRLDSNPIECDCDLVWLVQMLKDNLAHTQAAATCDSPGKWRGRALMDIDLAEFDCPNLDQNVGGVPVITNQPNDVEISFGNTAYLRCAAEGSPTPQIFWMKNNEIVDTTQSRYRLLDDGSLMIQNARSSDTGSYECVARNSVGEAKTTAAELTMTNTFNEQPHFTTRPGDVQAILGDTVDLPCSARGHPEPQITWTLNGRAVRLNSRVSFVGGGLHIVSVRDEDRGDYQCRAQNTEGLVSATARLTVQVAPHFVLRPVDTSLPAGSTAVFQCDAMGEPTPLISWFKDNEPLPNNGRFQIFDSGRTLRISSIQESDIDVYVCRAESSAGRMEAEAELQITSSSSTSTGNRQRVEEVEAQAGTDVTLDCISNGQPSNRYRWHKDGTELRNGRKYLIDRSEITIRHLIRSDAGLYECFPENTLGFARNFVRLNVLDRETISRPGDRFVDAAIRTATNRVDVAINTTRSELFDRSRSHSVEDLLSLFRYPSADSLEIARAQEVFEQTLEIIHQHVLEGHEYNLTDHGLSYQELVSPTHLALIANMSGCFRRTLPQKCTNMCFHKKYRTFDGSCNNLQNPSWGSANSALKRLLPPKYENGFNTPVGWNRGRLYNGVHLPSPRLVSSVLMSTDTVSTDNKDTHMLMQWGQFIDHDIDLTPQSVSQHIFNDGRRCNETCENAFPCFPIQVPSSDQRVRGQSCLGLHRSSATCNTGTTSIFFKTFSPRQQLNALTAYIDGSQIYGSSETLAETLRDLSHEHGLLLVGSLSQEGKRLLPYDFHGIIGAADCQIETSKRYIPCFLTGDSRGNEHLGLTAMHTLFMREHNRIAEELLDVNPHWDGNMLYHESRKIVSAYLQHITYTSWLPKILGPRGMEMLGDYKGYDPSVESSVTNEFATAAMRFGHSLVQPMIFRLNESFMPTAEGNLPLHKAFFAPYRIVEEGGIDPVIRGLFAQGAKMRMPHEIMNSELTERLFSLANSIGQDLASLNIQRGRDHGLPSYNDYRKVANLTRVQSFDDLQEEIQDRKTRDDLELLYSHVDNIDLFVGGMAETPLEGSKVGPTFAHILADQFKRLRSGDRFWYENPMVFTPDQLTQIKQTSLARIICDSSDAISRVQKDAFTMVHSKEEYVPCTNIPKMDLKMWSECCMDCGKAGDFRSITSHFRRRRTPDFSTQSDHPDASGTVAQLDHFRDQVYNKQEVDLKMFQMENKLVEMENVVHDMEANMKKMKRHMRRMMTSSKTMMCVEDDGTQRQHNDKWNKDECSTCKCRMGQIKCKTQPCPKPTCEFPKKMPGVCCLIC